MRIRGAKNLDLLIKNFDFTAKSKQGFILEGGSGSAKTYDVINFLILYCSKNKDKGKDILVFRQTLADLKKTAYKDFIKVLTMYGLYHERNHSMSAPINYKLYGNVIFFSGLDTMGVHGERHDIIWGNEGMELDKDAFKQLNQRCNEAFIVDYNPSSTDHWIFNDLEKRPDTKKFTSTQLDNPFLPRGQRDEILAYEPTAKNIEQGTADDYLWNVYGLGIRSAPEGLIFQHVEWINEFPTNVERVYFGLDFGYTNSPSALVKVGVHGRDMFVQCLFYDATPDPNELIAPLTEHCGKEMIWADPSGRGMIAILRRAGFNVMATNTFPGSIKTGLSMMKSYKQHWVRSAALVKEQSNYKYRTINGVKTDDPIDEYNHCFTGDTLITTDRGLIELNYVEAGDMVLTSEGLRRVLHKWHNGKKQAKIYRILCECFSIELCCTDNHKIKTTQGWTEIRKLQLGQEIYLHKPSMVKSTGYIQESGTIPEGQEECTLLYGNIITAKDHQDTTSITLTGTHGITSYPISQLKNHLNTYQNIQREWLPKTPNGLRGLERVQSENQRNGTQAKRAENGTGYTQRKMDSASLTTEWATVLSADQSLKRRVPMQNTAAQIVSSHITGIWESDPIDLEVFDLHVEGCHEYFANGVLVHNCIDAARMPVISNLRIGTNANNS